MMLGRNTTVQKIEIWWYGNKIGMIKRRLAWALHEDDTHESRNVRTFFLQKKRVLKRYL